MPAGSIERTTCYGKRLRTIRSLFRIRKMPADRGLRGYRGRPGRAGLPQARGPQALKLRGNPRLRFAEVCGPRADGDAFAASGGHVVSGRKKAPQFGCGAFLQAYCETRFAVDQFDALPGPRAAEYRPAEEPEFLADRAVQAQVEDRVHHLFGKCRGVDFGQ